MSGIYIYLWLISKKKIIWGTIKSLIIILLATILNFISSVFDLLDPQEAIIINFIFAGLILFTHTFYFCDVYEKLYAVRFDRFVESTPVTYKKLLFGLINSNFLLYLKNYCLCIILFILKYIFISNSLIFELQVLTFGLFINLIFSTLLIPLMVAFKDKKTVLLTFTAIIILLNSLFVKNNSFNWILKYNFSLIALILMLVVLILSFAAWKVANIIWKYGD